MAGYGLEDATTALVTLDGAEEGAEVALTKAVVVFALGEHVCALIVIVSLNVWRFCQQWGDC